MKKLIIALLLLPIVPLMAQEGGLKNVIGGQIAFQSLKGASEQFGQFNLNGDDNEKTRSINLFPYAAWKVTNHWLLGFRLGYGRAYGKEQYFGGTNIYYLNNYSMTRGIRLIGRYYLRPSAKFGLFIEPTLGYLGTKTKQRNAGANEYYNHISYDDFNFQAAPGLAYHFTEKLGLLVRMGQVGYGFGKRNSEDTGTSDKYSNFFFDFNLNYIYWGLEYRWGGTIPKEQTPPTN